MNKEEVQEMINQSIAESIRKHNRNAGIISMIVGWVLEYSSRTEKGKVLQSFFK